MTDPAFPYAKIMGPRSHGSETAAKGRAKFLSAKIQRNPLKMLDPDERIQGNPSFSNAQNQGSSRPNGLSPRKPKSDQPGPTVAPAPPRSQAGSTPMHSGLRQFTILLL